MAQIPIEGEAPRAAGWEFGAAATAFRIDDAFAPEVDAQWTPAFGGWAAWRPAPLAALGVEAWRSAPDGENGRLTTWGVGAHLRATPWAARGWALDPALHFGIESISADDDEDRGLAFVAGAGVAHLARRWTLDLAVRNHRLSVDEDPVVPEEGGEPIKTARDASIWEVRAGLAVVFSAGG